MSADAFAGGAIALLRALADDKKARNGLRWLMAAAYKAGYEPRVGNISLYKLQPDSRLGLTLMGNGCPYVERVAEGGAAFGRLVVGDTILAVNGHQARGHEATTTQLKSLQGAVMLHVRRREQ